MDNSLTNSFVAGGFSNNRNSATSSQQIALEGIQAGLEQAANTFNAGGSATEVANDAATAAYQASKFAAFETLAQATGIPSPILQSATRAILDGVSNGGGNGGGTDNNNSFTSSSKGNYTINLGVEPSNLELSTGIVPNTFSSDWQTASWAGDSLLELSASRLELPSDTANPIFAYIRDIVTLRIQNLAQQNVTFNINLAQFTSLTLTAYLNSLFYALQTYYYYDSILNYSNVPGNKNQAVRALRANFDAATLNKIANLRQILDGIPIPPNLIALTWWLGQIYATSDIPGTSLRLIIPKGLNYASTSNEFNPSLIDDIDTIIADLANHRGTQVILTRCFPMWASATVIGSSGVPNFDPGFNTLFTNLAGITTNTAGADLRFPMVSTVDTVIPYANFDNDLDGGIFSLNSIFIGTQASYSIRPGLLRPVEVAYTYNTQSRKTSRFSYKYGSTTNTFKANNCEDLFNLRNRNEAWNLLVNSNAYTEFVKPFACQLLESVTARSIDESARKMVEWMFTFAATENPYGPRARANKPKGREKRGRNN